MGKRIYVSAPQDDLPADIVENHPMRLKRRLKDIDFDEIVFSPYWDVTHLEPLLYQGLFDGKQVFVARRSSSYMVIEEYPSVGLNLFDPPHMESLFPLPQVTRKINIAEPDRQFVQFRSRSGSRKRIVSDNIQMPRFVSIVIASRTPSLLKRCIDHLERKAGIRHEYIIVSPKRYELPVAHTWIQSPEPFCTAKAFNSGISAARYDTVALINDDFFLNTTGGLLVLARLANRLPTGIAAPATNFTSCPEQKQRNVGVVEPETFIPAICWVFRKEVAEEIGYFDEGLAHHYGGDDVDFCYRAVLKGYRLLIDTGVYGHHEGGATWGDKANDITGSRDYLVHKWGDDIHKSEYWERAKQPYDCVSVITCRDDDHSIYHAVDSARYWGSDFVIVVHNGCVTHEKLFERRRDVQELYFPLNLGQWPATNIGIDFSRCRVVHPMDADDVIKGSLRDPINMILSGEYDVVAGVSEMTGAMEQLRVPEWDIEKLAKMVAISHGAYLLRRSLFDHGLCYDEGLISGSDYVLLAELALQPNLKLGVHPYIIHEYRTTTYHTQKGKYWNLYGGNARNRIKQYRREVEQWRK